MSEQNLNHKRHMVASLERMLAEKLTAAQDLENKARETLKFASEGLGILSFLGIVIADALAHPFILGGIVVVFVLYLFLFDQVRRAVKPQVYKLVPGIPKPKDRGDWADFEATYLLEGEEDYLDQLIVDYAGDGESSEGAIWRAEHFNSQKAKHIERASFVLTLIVIVLLLMAGIAIYLKLSTTP